jgi:hypothetical protein
MLSLLACAKPDPGEPVASAAVWADAGVETLPDAPPGPVDDERAIFTDTGVLEFGIELDDAAIAQLEQAPTEYVGGSFVFRGQRYAPVGVRLKGNSTYQWLDARPAWKVKFDEFVPGARFYGLERVTLNSNYWDGSMMAETLAYRLWRKAGNPAPRTGYANVTFNGELVGLYTVVESMDDGFVEAWWPDSEGGLYEMCRTCDFQLDCSAYPLQETGESFDETGLARACAAAATGDADEIRAHFDWERLVTWMALERVANHSDSYSYNLNNYYVYHDPLTDRVTLTPWGADSTFSYAYPPDADTPCQPGYFDNLANDPGAYLARWCRADAVCWAEVEARMSALGELLVEEDFAGFVARTRDRIDDAVAADPRWPWGVDTWTSKAACFETWIAARPAEIEAFVAAH